MRRGVVSLFQTDRQSVGNLLVSTLWASATASEEGRKGEGKKEESGSMPASIENIVMHLQSSVVSLMPVESSKNEKVSPFMVWSGPMVIFFSC